jgi:hypothetical protein
MCVQPTVCFVSDERVSQDGPRLERHVAQRIGTFAGQRLRKHLPVSNGNGVPTDGRGFSAEALRLSDSQRARLHDLNRLPQPHTSDKTAGGLNQWIRSIHRTGGY